MDEPERLYAILRRHVGAEKAVASADCEAMLGLGDRDVRRAVLCLVRDGGVPVCSSTRDGRAGYFLPGSIDEALASLDPRLKHGKSELASAYRVKRAAQTFFEGQRSFGFAEPMTVDYPEKLNIQHPTSNIQHPTEEEEEREILGGILVSWKTNLRRWLETVVGTYRTTVVAILDDLDRTDGGSGRAPSQ